MDFSQTRLKLRVAVCPYVAPVGPEYHHRVVGMKRDSGSSASLVILRQFLLLLPLDCTFADLTARVINQYEKLYRNQPAYVSIKSIALFRDSNQCDLDLDYLVSDICASNDLIYAMVEIEESNKKIKIVTEEVKQPQPVEIVKNNQNQGKGQNEKKVPEFKPTPVKAPATVKQSPVKTEAKNESKLVEIAKPSKPVENKVVKSQETKAQVAEKVPEVKVSDVKAAVPVKTPETKTNEPKVAVPIKAPESKVAIPIKAPEPKVAVPVRAPESQEVIPVKAQDAKVAEPKDAKISETKVPTPIAKPTAPFPVPVKTPAAKKNQKQVEEVKKEALVTETFSDPVVPVISEPVVVPDISMPAFVTKPLAPVVSESVDSHAHSHSTATYSEAVSNEKRANDMITPVPTPVSRPIFHPRKSEIPPLSSSSDEEEVDSVLNTFDATNLFGSQVIASEPRRSEAFVLFAAGSSDDSNYESEREVKVVPMKSSSIVSMQAAPSSELNEEESDDDDQDESESESTADTQLPHSVTLRRLSSVSPIPDPSEIPSLHELKESINRAPTPIQIIQNNNKNVVKGGRPAKKQNTGRPKKTAAVTQTKQ